MSKIPRQLLLPGGKRVIDERYAEHRHRLIGMLRDYLAGLRASPVSSPGFRIHRASRMLQGKIAATNSAQDVLLTYY